MILEGGIVSVVWLANDIMTEVREIFGAIKGEIVLLHSIFFLFLPWLGITVEHKWAEEGAQGLSSQNFGFSFFELFFGCVTRGCVCELVSLFLHTKDSGTRISPARGRHGTVVNVRTIN